MVAGVAHTPTITAAPVGTARPVRVVEQAMVVCALANQLVAALNALVRLLLQRYLVVVVVVLLGAVALEEA